MTVSATLATAAVMTATALIFLVFVGRWTGRISGHTFHGWCAIANGINLVACVVLDFPATALINAAAFALAAWMWWNGGGGDGTKRRLRRWAARFQGVRRTAPAAAS